MYIADDFASLLCFYIFNNTNKLLSRFPLFHLKLIFKQNIYQTFYLVPANKFLIFNVKLCRSSIFLFFLINNQKLK